MPLLPAYAYEYSHRLGLEWNINGNCILYINYMQSSLLICAKKGSIDDGLEGKEYECKLIQELERNWFFFTSYYSFCCRSCCCCYCFGCYSYASCLAIIPLLHMVFVYVLLVTMRLCNKVSMNVYMRWQ